MQVTLCFDREVHEGVSCEQLQHVIKKTDSGADVGLARAVQVYRDRDRCFLGLTIDCSAAVHGVVSARGVRMRGMRFQDCAIMMSESVDKY